MSIFVAQITYFPANATEASVEHFDEVKMELKSEVATECDAEPELTAAVETATDTERMTATVAITDSCNNYRKRNANGNRSYYRNNNGCYD